MSSSRRDKTAATAVAYNIVNHAERRLATPPDATDPCLCVACTCGKHKCPGIACRPRLESRTAYRDEFPQRDLGDPHRLRVAKEKWQSIARAGAVATRADTDHFVTTSGAFFGGRTTNPALLPPGAAPRSRHSASEDALPTFQSSYDELYTQHWRQRNYKPEEHFTPASAFRSHTTAQELLPQHPIASRPTRHSAKLRTANRGNFLVEGVVEGVERSASAAGGSAVVRSTMHEQQLAVQNATMDVGGVQRCRPPPALPRAQIIGPSGLSPQRARGEEFERPSSSYSVHFGGGGDGLPSTPAGVVRRLRNAPRPLPPKVEETRDFATSNTASYTVHAVQRSPRRNGYRSVEQCEGAPLYAAAKATAVEPDGHIHLRNIVPSPPRRVA